MHARACSAPPLAAGAWVLLSTSPWPKKKPHSPAALLDVLPRVRDDAVCCCLLGVVGESHGGLVVEKVSKVDCCARIAVWRIPLSVSRSPVRRQRKPVQCGVRVPRLSHPQAHKGGTRVKAAGPSLGSDTGMYVASRFRLSCCSCRCLEQSVTV